ncbi:hypothetical protein Hanom_Chr06g00502871 [Helianthus anomalus]
MTEKEFDPPPENFSDLDITQMQEEILKRQVRQSYGFVKLRLSDSRTPVFESFSGRKALHKEHKVTTSDF